MPIGKLDGGTTESCGETRRLRLHLQHRSGKTHSGKRVGAHGIPHHLINGGHFGFLEGISQNRLECGQATHSQDTFVQYSLITARTAHSMRLAWLKFKTKRDLQASLCPKMSLVIWCVTCLIHGCSLMRLPPRALPLLHLPILPHNESTKYIPHISKLTQSTSNAVKNHSGVKTCRVAETRPQLPQAQGNLLRACTISTAAKVELRSKLSGLAHSSAKYFFL